jgi:hypothetical protein
MKRYISVISFAFAALSLMAFAIFPGSYLSDASISEASTVAMSETRIEDEKELRSFEVMVTNLTPSDSMEHGQPFSPSLLVTHNSSAKPLFKIGQRASFGLQRLAEEGNSGPTLSAEIVPMLGKSYGHATTQISILPGQSRSTYITTSAQFPLLSGFWMLVRTNDGFTGLDSINLWNLKEKEKIALEIDGYDAGTERNNERSPFLVAKEGSQRDPETAVVSPHSGIKGTADAPPTWKFMPKAVARVTITRVKLDKDLMMIRNGGMIVSKN